MLILSRKVGQSIVIAGNIVVKVVRVEGDQIKPKSLAWLLTAVVTGTLLWCDPLNRI